ncbi:hypothetical protein L1887_19300 [Cichorium endivia]|nr:hypothetical protein L1887_19300 [Cichorium endivia]
MDGKPRRRDELSKGKRSPEGCVVGVNGVAGAEGHHRKRISDAVMQLDGKKRIKSLMGCQSKDGWNRVNKELNNELKEEPLKARPCDVYFASTCLFAAM